MLRRSLQKLISDLEAAIQRVEVLSLSLPTTTTTTTTKQMKKKAASSSTSTTAKPIKQPELDRVVERAMWMKAVLGPRAYEGFSQLTADRQFAQLGLVLIGVLAQVEAAMAPFLPAEPSPKPQPEEKSLGSVRIGQETSAPKVVADAGDLEVDLGVAISRDELDDGISVQPSIEPSSSTKGHLDMENISKGKKRKKPKNEAIESRAQVSEFPSEISDVAEKRKKPSAAGRIPKSTKPESIIEELQEPPKKHKKPKLDVSSSSLLAEKQEPITKTLDEAKVIKKTKKKKKKGGDEFDDLFSSLL